MTDPTLTPVTDVPVMNGQTLQTQCGNETSAPEAVSAVEVTGKTIAGYVIEGELGRGGMGVVYKARQKGLSRLVALKMILHADHAGAEDGLRFLREAESLAQLKHENIVQIYEVGEHEGKPFISLEYVEGGSLDRRLAGTPLPPREAARLVEQLADAMQTAHEVGIVHRDLKPANVLLAGAGLTDAGDMQPKGTRAALAGFNPKVTDFGLAKRQDAGGLSVSGAVMGTPSYMAPEQARGQGKDSDARTDVYALGAILYECLTGRPPFRAASAVDTMMQVLNDEPVGVRTLQSGTPPDLETICLKCLQKEPGRRYQSARELAEDLRRFYRGEPVMAHPVGSAERGWRWCRRNPTVASLLAGVALLLVTGTVISTAFGLKAKSETARAERALGDLTIKERDERRAKEKEMEARIEETRQRKQAEQLLYAGLLSLAMSHWNEGNVTAAREKLEEAALIRIDEKRPTQETWEYRCLHTLMNHRGHRTLWGHTLYVRGVAVSPDGRRIASAGGDIGKRGSVKVWDTATGRDVLTLMGHQSGVYSVAFSPDGSQIASGSEDRTVKVWDAVTGKLQRTLQGHTGRITSVRFSPDGTKIASGSFDNTMKLWDAATDRELLTLKGHTSSILDVNFSPDGKKIASASYDRTVKVWDVVAGQTLLTFQGHSHPVRSVTFSPDGTRIASGGADRTVKLWDARTGQHLLTLLGHRDEVAGVAFSPDGRRVASGSDDETVRVWDAQTGQAQFTLQGHTFRVTGVSFSPDGRQIISGGEDRRVKVWDAVTGQGVLTLRGHTGTILSVSFSPDSKQVASAGFDDTVKVWDARTGLNLLNLKGHTHTVNSVAFSPDGKWLASGSTDKTVKVWDARTGQNLLTLEGHTGDVESVVFSPDGTRIVSGSYDETVKMWDASTGQDLRTFKGHTRCVHSVGFHPDGKHIVSGSWDRTAKVWDATTGRDLLTLQGHTDLIESVSFSPDGTRIASGSRDRTVMLWDAQTGQVVFTLKGHTSEVRSVSFSPDGTRLASAASPETGKPGEVKVWDTVAGEELITLKGHTNPVNCVSFSHNGQRLASGSNDWTVRVWDAQAEPPPLVLKGHTDYVTAACFSPDGTRIASGSYNGEVKVWDGQTGQTLLSHRGHGNSAIEYLHFSLDGHRLHSWDRHSEHLTWDLGTGKAIEVTDEEVAFASRRSRNGRFFAFTERNDLRVHRLPTGKEAEEVGHRWWIDSDRWWHAAQAEEAWYKEEWFAAAFHLGRLLRERPWNASNHLFRGYALAQLDRTSEAIPHFLTAVLLDPHVRMVLPLAKPRVVMPRAAD